MKEKQGFTLIELLAVIVILAVIALIATSLIMGTITKAKLNSYKDTVYGILKAGEKYVAELLLENENTYTGETIDLKTESKLAYKGTKPSKGSLVITKDGDLSITSEYAGYCFYKGYKDSEVHMSKGDCDDMYDYDGKLAIPTDKKCFETNEDGTMITKYLCYEGNDLGLPTITEVSIPEEIKSGTKVTEIQGVNDYTTKAAFLSKNLTKINIPKTVIKIGQVAFNDNLVEDKDEPFIYARSDVDGDGIAEVDRTNVIGYAGVNKHLVIPSSIKKIGNGTRRAFSDCKLKTIFVPDSVEYIASASFQNNQITEIKHMPKNYTAGGFIFIDNRLSDENAFFYNRYENGLENRASLNSYAGAKRTEVIVPGHIKVITDYALARIDNIILSDGLERIYPYGLHEGKQTKLTIPSTVIEMSPAALGSMVQLNTIVNKTGKAWDWGIILKCPSTGTFETGTVTCPNRTVQITK